MEKVNTKTTSAPKPTNSDLKNKQDGVGHNKHLRSGPRGAREGGEGGRRKQPNPQKNRELFDKRPRNRNGAHFERYRSEVADGAVGEPPGKQGCKKMNLNHLLNFTLAPMEHWDGRKGAMHTRHRMPKYNKELFLQANCQFVARDNGEFSVPQKNPDVLLEWSLIEEIRLPCHDEPLCPICLCAPTAAKITRCGHVYCWPCMLHYLSLTDKTWQKCPICFEAVHGTDLKSVSLRVRKCFLVGDAISMCLMQREKGSLMSTPVVHKVATNAVCSVADDDSITRYQKLLLASQLEVQLILDRERRELDTAYLAEKDTPEVCFIESALQLLGEREKSLHHVIDNENSISKQAHEENVVGNVRKHLTSISSTDSNDESYNADINDNSAAIHAVSNINNTSKITSCDSEKGISYFYQAEDGQHIYLHNVNVRMLLKEFGSLESAPHTISAKIVEVERVTMTEVLRKKLRYLQHLPLTCEFQFVELDFGSTVSESILQQFEGEIKKRRFARNRKARDERRREKMIEQEENKKLGKYPKATYNLNSAAQFPAYQPEDFLSRSPPKQEGHSSPDVNAVNLNGNNYCEDFPGVSVNESSSPHYSPATSFAQMLRDGQKMAWRPVERKPPSPVPTNNPPDSDEEGTAAPEFRQSFSDAFQLALDKIALQEPQDKTQTSSKKKKKGKKQILFTTAMCRNNNN